MKRYAQIFAMYGYSPRDRVHYLFVCPRYAQERLESDLGSDTYSMPNILFHRNVRGQLHFVNKGKWLRKTFSKVWFALGSHGWNPQQTTIRVVIYHNTGCTTHHTTTYPRSPTFSLCLPHGSRVNTGEPLTRNLWAWCALTLQWALPCHFELSLSLLIVPSCGPFIWLRCLRTLIVHTNHLSDHHDCYYWCGQGQVDHYCYHHQCRHWQPMSKRPPPTTQQLNNSMTQWLDKLTTRPPLVNQGNVRILNIWFT